MSEEQEEGRRSDTRTIYVIVGVVLILVGVGLLGGIPIFGWTWGWTALGEILREARRIGWPLALITIGVLVIAYSRRPAARLPSREARLVRSREKKVLAGVMGGLSDFLSMDVTLLRLGYLLLAFVFNAWGPLLVVYIAAAIIMPQEPETKQDTSSEPGTPASPPDIEDGGGA